MCEHLLKRLLNKLLLSLRGRRLHLGLVCELLVASGMVEELGPRREWLVTFVGSELGGVWLAFRLFFEFVSKLPIFELTRDSLRLRGVCTKHLSLVVGDLHLDFVNIVFKVPFLAVAVREDHPAVPVLNS